MTQNGTDRRTDVPDYINEEFIYFIGPATPPSACYSRLHKRNRRFCTFLKYSVQKDLKYPSSCLLMLRIKTNN